MTKYLVTWCDQFSSVSTPESQIFDNLKRAVTAYDSFRESQSQRVHFYVLTDPLENREIELLSKLEDI